MHTSKLFAFFRCLKNTKWFLELSTEPAKILILKHLELKHRKINTEVWDKSKCMRFTNS